MSGVLIPSLALKEFTTIRRVRELPIPGRTLVRVGQTVSADTSAAEAELPGELMMLRIPEALGIEAEDVLSKLEVKTGDAVKKGDILCSHAGLFGLFRSVFRSPCDGVVELISERTGHVGVRGAPKVIRLRAYISGKVVASVEGKSATIETRGAFIQGIFGFGGERSGAIKMLSARPDERLELKHIPDDAAGLILVGGTAPSIEVLNKASTAGAVGLVTGAIDDQAMAAYLGFDLGIALTGDEDLKMTVIVTEGFGRIPISERIINLLSSLSGMTASINGATQVRAGALRPELIIPLESGTERSGIGGHGLAVGIEVRVIRVPYFGAVGVVSELPKEPLKIETGATARVVKIKLGDGQEVAVPRANVEIL